MLAQRQYLTNAEFSHNLEAYRVGKTESLIGKFAQPSIDCRRLKRAVGEDDLVRRVLIHAVEKSHGLG